MAEKKVSIRLAENADLGFIRQRGHLPHDEVIQRKILQEEIIVILVGHQYAGMLSIEFLWSIVPYIALIWIEEPYRHRGYSRTLLAYVEVRLRSEGHEILYSSSQADEPEPQAWHRHMGFEECGIINGINLGGIGEIFFKKAL